MLASRGCLGFMFDDLCIGTEFLILTKMSVFVIHCNVANVEVVMFITHADISRRITQTNDPKVFKLGIGNDLQISYKWLK